MKEIADKIIEFQNKYNQLYPQYYIAGLVFDKAKAKILMSQEVVGLGSQPLREAEASRILSQTKEYEQYHKIYPEYHLCKVSLDTYKLLGRMRQAIQWEETR